MTQHESIQLAEEEDEIPRDVIYTQPFDVGQGTDCDIGEDENMTVNASTTHPCHSVQLV